MKACYALSKIKDLNAVNWNVSFLMGKEITLITLHLKLRVSM